MFVPAYENTSLSRKPAKWYPATPGSNPSQTQPSLDPLNYQNLKINSRYQVNAPPPIQQSNESNAHHQRQQYSTFSTGYQASTPLVLPLGPPEPNFSNRSVLNASKPPLYNSAPVQQYPTSAHTSPTKRILHLQVPYTSFGTAETSRDVMLMEAPPNVQDLQTPRINPDPLPNSTVSSVTHAQCSSVFQRCTLNAIPHTKELLKKSRLPLSLILDPYPNTQSNNVNIPLINDSSVTRCTKCRSYINPFIQFAEGGTKWQCNFCDTKNQVPPSFDWDSTHQRPVDRWSRLELNHGSVDIIAPSEYIQSPLQPPVYAFIIDISAQSVQTGMVSVVADGILEALDSIPNPLGRVRVTFLTVDSGIGFYSLSGKYPELMVVSDISEIYLPRTTSDLVVNLLECRPIVEDLLQRMTEMHTKQNTNSNCLGVAIEATKRLLAPSGGKIICFQGSLPNVGEGAIRSEDFKKTASSDMPIMSYQEEFYRSISSDCCKTNISIEMFVFGSHSVDLSTMNVLSRFTGGQTHYFPGFTSKNGAEANKLRQEIRCILKQDIGLEGVMRTRCSSGIICKSFHGNFTPLASDVMLLPNVPQGQSFHFELSIEAEICTPASFFQTALIYTTSSGERRIRVMTLYLPVTKSLSELYAHADQVAIAKSLCVQSIEKAVTQKRRDGTTYLIKEVIGICKSYSKEMTSAKPNTNNNIQISRSLSLLPLLIFGILKSETFNDVNAIPLNICTQTTLLLRSLPLQEWTRIVHPNLYSLHNLPSFAGTKDTLETPAMPPPMNLSLGNFESHGCYLLENGQRIMIWIGKSVVPQLCKDLLNVSDITQVISGQIDCLPTIDNPLSRRVHSIIKHLRSSQRLCTYYPSIYIIKEDTESPLRSLFISHLVESTVLPHIPEKKNIISSLSYLKWLYYIRDRNY